MRQIARVTLLIITLPVLSACGGPAPVAEPSVVPSPTSEPVAATAEPALAEAAPTEASAAEEGPTRVEITLADNTIASSMSSFTAGAAYVFVITNKGRHEHNFNIAPPVAIAGGYSESLAQALLAVDETQIPPGSSTSVEFTFPGSASGADLEFSCLIRRHYEDGMRMEITVTS